MLQTIEITKQISNKSFVPAVIVVLKCLEKRFATTPSKNVSSVAYFQKIPLKKIPTRPTNLKARPTVLPKPPQNDGFVGLTKNHRNARDFHSKNSSSSSSDLFINSRNRSSNSKTKNFSTNSNFRSNSASSSSSSSVFHSNIGAGSLFLNLFFFQFLSSFFRHRMKKVREFSGSSKKIL